MKRIKINAKIMPSWSNHGNVNLAVQGQLLTIIEGSIQSVKGTDSEKLVIESFVFFTSIFNV